MKNSTDDDKGLPKYLKTRYWSSREELRLVELWRLYNSQIESFLIKQPAFRQISEEMRSYGTNVTPQDCRRKLNALNNRYMLELRQMKSNDKFVSDWNLFPLIHHIRESEKHAPVELHEEKIVNELIATIPLDKYPDPANCEDSGFPVGNSQLVYPTTSTTTTTTTTTASTTAATKHKYGDFSNIQPPTTQRTVGKMHFVLPYNITVARLQQIRDDNRRLVEERDIALKQLKLEVNEYAFLVTCFQQWQSQQETILQRLENKSYTALSTAVYE